MNKRTKLISAFLCAIPGVACAQSNVSIYGLIDVGVAQRNGGHYEGGTTNPVLTNNADYASRWGMRGTEDIGGGLKANFALEQTFKPMTGVGGASGINGFDRQAWVGMSGDFGEFRLGRQASVINQVLIKYDLNYGPNTGSAYGNVALQAIYDAAYGTRRSGQFQYWSPRLGGFSAQVGWIGKTDINLPNPKDVYQIGGNYDAGAFSAGIAYESKHADVPGLKGNWGAGAKYNFGPVVVSANYYDNARDSDGRGYGAGFMVPVTKSANFGVQVAHNTVAKATSWEVFGNYDLSKRTAFYMLYSGMDNNAAAFSNAGKKNSWAVGMLHKF